VRNNVKRNNNCIVIVFGILTISWFYFSWKIEKEEKEKKENEDKKKDSQRNEKK
jgi:hypothetical protein